jgi:hypothetical protein
MGGGIVLVDGPEPGVDRSASRGLGNVSPISMPELDGGGGADEPGLVEDDAGVDSRAWSNPDAPTGVLLL